MFDNISQRQQDLLFKKLLSMEDNAKCADCKQKGATWASLGFGVFVCIQCSGIHRSFPMYVTRVRSSKLDSWSKADAKIMEVIGNQTANMYWEHKIMFHQKEKLYLENDMRQFIMNKYDIKSYAKSDAENPVDVLVNSHYQISALALKNMYAPNQKKEKKKQKSSNFDFIHNSSKKSKKDDLDLLGLIDEPIQKQEKILQNDLLNMDLNQTIPYQKKNDFDLDFLSLDTKPQNVSDYDYSQPNQYSFNNTVGQTKNIINIQNYNVYNQIPNTQQSHQQYQQQINQQKPQNNDKYGAFDFLQNGYF